MRKTIAYYGTCAARSRVTLASKRIKQPYYVRQIQATFAPGCLNLVQLSFHASLDASVPTSARPDDPSILAENGQVDYLVGDGDIKIVRHDLEIDEGGTYLKVHAYNQDWYDHAIDVQIEIDLVSDRTPVAPAAGGT